MRFRKHKKVTLRDTYVPDFFGSTKAKNILVPQIIKNEPQMTYKWTINLDWLFIGVLLMILLSQVSCDIKFEVN